MKKIVLAVMLSLPGVACAMDLGPGVSSLNSSTVTLQGNTFNGASQLLKLDSNSWAGIGTTSPATNLDVQASSSAHRIAVSIQNTHAAGASSFQVKGATGNVTMYLFNTNSSWATGGIPALVTGMTSMLNNEILVAVNEGSGASIYLARNGKVSISDGANTSPAYTMDVSGVVKSSDSIISSGVAQSGQAVCFTTTGQLGHCTSVVGAGGGCTCVSN